MVRKQKRVLFSQSGVVLKGGRKDDSYPYVSRCHLLTCVGMEGHEDMRRCADVDLRIKVQRLCSRRSPPFFLLLAFLFSLFSLSPLVFARQAALFAIIASRSCCFGICVVWFDELM